MDFLTLALCKKASGGIIPTKVSDLSNDAGYVTATALNGYAQEAVVNAALAGKQDALTFDDTPTAGSGNPVKSGGVASAIASAITDAFAGISQFSVYRCGNGEYDPQTLEPTVASPDSLHIYLVPDGSNYREYIYVNNGWDLIGTTEIDLSGYVQESDLEDYVKTEDLPAVPTKVSELENDEGYITNPRTTHYEKTVTSDETMQMGPGYVGGLNSVDVMYTEIGQSVYQWAADETSQVYAAPKNVPVVKLDLTSSYLFAYNLKPTETGAAYGFDVDDVTKSCFGIIVQEDEESSTGYSLIIIASADICTTWKLYTMGQYLTEHQSLAGYAKTADVNTALAGKQDTLQYDDAPTQSSTKLLTSGKIYNALAAKQNTLSFDNAPTQNSSNPVKSGGVYTALAGKQNVLTWDDTPTANSVKPVKSGGVYTALAGKQNVLTWDDTPTANSVKPVKSGGIKTYVDGKVPTNLVTGDGASYTVKVSTSAPASGTASSIITIVVPE